MSKTYFSMKSIFIVALLDNFKVVFSLKKFKNSRWTVDSNNCICLLCNLSPPVVQLVSDFILWFCFQYVEKELFEQWPGYGPYHSHRNFHSKTPPQQLCDWQCQSINIKCFVIIRQIILTPLRSHANKCFVIIRQIILTPLRSHANKCFVIIRQIILTPLRSHANKCFVIIRQIILTPLRSHANKCFVIIRQIILTLLRSHANKCFVIIQQILFYVQLHFVHIYIK